ncbi:MAG TPA: prolyl oligopeptidase family serine peptidase [Polyangia bacterium]|nr:prolyl oligopeptidase family serine peptidase [Polyangia bacterium]
MRIALILVAAATLVTNNMKYPETKRDAVVDDVHGVKIPDPYRWLEDAGKPDVKAWMAAEDKLARGVLSQLPGRDKLIARLKELLYLETFTPPHHFGNRYFYTRRHKDKEKAILYWKEGAGGDEKVLLDPNTLSPDGSTSLGVWNPSWDGKTLVYGLKPNNSDETILHVMNVATGKVSDVDVIAGGKYAGPSWTPRGDGFYYVWVPPLSDTLTPAERPGYAELRFHALGADPASDKVVHQRTGNPQTFLGGYLSKDGHWLIAVIQHGWNASDVYYRDMRSKDLAWRPFVVGKPFIYNIDAHKDVFYVTTNEDAPRWRVFRVDPRHADRASWREIVAERKDVVIESANVLGNRLMVRTMRNASSGLEVRDLHGTLVRQVALPGIGTVGGVVGDEDDDEAYFSFESFTTTPRSYKTSMQKGGAELFYEVKVPVDATPYTVEQVWYPSKDGTNISMFIVRRKDMPKDGTTPFMLTGYGGFQVSMTPSFGPSLFPWLDAGGGYALPNLRGGGEYGEEWHKAGMREHKQNVFDDFAAAAEWLIANKYTRADKLAIRGGSNGGLLMGAAVTQHPELFRAVICAVPLLDMLRYHLFGSGKTWIPEYGSAEDPKEFEWINGYSPYQKVKSGTKYPALLMMSADSDDRVDPMHARKMTAALQWAQGGGPKDGRPVLMRIEKHSGHGGADLVKQAVEQSADSYAFLMYELGMKP